MTSVFAFIRVSVCVCCFYVCVMYGLWKLTAGVQSRCQVAAGNMKESQRGSRGLVRKPDLQNQCSYKRANDKIREMASITKTQRNYLMQKYKDTYVYIVRQKKFKIMYTLSSSCLHWL